MARNFLFCGKLFVVGCVMMSAAGCAGVGLPASFDFFGGNDIRVVEANETNPAVEIHSLWQPADGRGEKGMPTRGFAGQVLFFTATDSAPVVVDGDVRIYLFDDVGSAEEQAKPLHQFDFSAEVWNRHFQDSMLGPSYHVFIPYVRRDHHRVNCALCVRLTPREGPVIYSELTSVTLPGTARKDELNDEGMVGPSNQFEQTSADDQLAGEFSRLFGDRSKTDQTLQGTRRSSREEEQRPMVDNRQLVEPSIRQVLAIEEFDPSDANDQNSSDGDDRISRLEAMVAHLVELQTSASRKHRKSRMSDDGSRFEIETRRKDRRRFKLTGHKDDAADYEEAAFPNTTESRRVDTEPRERRLHRHPLKQSSHPLDEMQSNLRSNARFSKQKQSSRWNKRRRHLLEDEGDEQFKFVSELNSGENWKHPLQNDSSWDD